VFTKETAAGILSLNELTAENVNNFICNTSTDRGPLHPFIINKADDSNCIKIIENLVERASKLVAANLAAVVLKTNKGKSASRPILITIEGTAFYKMHNLRPAFENYFAAYLSGERERFYEFTEVKQSSLVGAALAALIN
jgi:hexokinase